MANSNGSFHYDEVMRTEAQTEASRRNGSLSKGPVTVGGKARSARNNTRNGLVGSTIILEVECQNKRETLSDPTSTSSIVMTFACAGTMTVPSRISTICAPAGETRKKIQFCHSNPTIKPNPLPSSGHAHKERGRLCTRFLLRCGTPGINPLKRVIRWESNLINCQTQAPQSRSIDSQREGHEEI